MKRAAIGLCLVWFLAGVGAAGETGSARADRERELAYRKNLEEGAEYLRQGKNASALGRFNSASKLIPDKAAAYYWIALTYSDFKSYTEAAEFAKKAATSPKPMEPAWLPWLIWGQSLMYLGEWKEAKAKLDEADRFSGGDPVVSFNRARCYYHGFRNLADARQLFQETLRRIDDANRVRLAPLYRQCVFYLGCCYLESDDQARAAATFRDLLKLEPRHAEARLRLGIVYRRTGRIAEAEEEIRWVVKDNPRHYEASLQLAYLYLKERKNERFAEHYFKLYLKYAPANHPWRERVEKWVADRAKPAADAGTTDSP